MTQTAQPRGIIAASGLVGAQSWRRKCLSSKSTNTPSTKSLGARRRPFQRSRVSRQRPRPSASRSDNEMHRDQLRFAISDLFQRRSEPYDLYLGDRGTDDRPRLARRPRAPISSLCEPQRQAEAIPLRSTSLSHPDCPGRACRSVASKGGRLAKTDFDVVSCVRLNGSSERQKGIIREKLCRDRQSHIHFSTSGQGSR
jgi:hypothetical protein